MPSYGTDFSVTHSSSGLLVGLSDFIFFAFCPFPQSFSLTQFLALPLWYQANTAYTPVQ